jgi:Transcriptional regulator, AbiEi antitoxin
MEQIKLTAELLAEGWGFHELHRMARAGELQRIRRGAYECAPREITRAARATSSSDCSNSPSDVSRRSRQPHVSRCAASAPHLEQPARTSSHHPRWVGGRKGTQLRPSSCGPTTSDRGMRDRGSASYHAGAHRTRPAANADDGAVRAHRRCSAQTGPDAGGSGRTRGPMHRLARHAPSAASHELPGSTSESPGESCSRVVLHRIDVPAPTPQYEVWEPGVLVGRVDFCWEEFRTGGSSMAERNMGNLSSPGRRRPTQFLRRSAERMRCAISAGRSSAGSGRTSITPRICGAAWNARSRGVCGRPEEPDAPPCRRRATCCLDAPLIDGGVIKRD